MGMSIKIKMLLVAKEMTVEDLAKKLNPITSRQNMAAKLKKDNFTDKDLREIAEACGVKYEGFFILEDGRRI